MLELRMIRLIAPGKNYSGAGISQSRNQRRGAFGVPSTTCIMIGIIRGTLEG